MLLNFYRRGFRIKFLTLDKKTMSKELNRPIRVLLVSVVLVGHDRRCKVIDTTILDAVMEIVYSGLRLTADVVVNAALREDVDAIGISILSAARMTVFSLILRQMRDKGI